MSTLFDLPKPVRTQKSKHRCRSCDHIYSHEYNSSMKYCRMQKSNRTAYGHKKIKANDFGCNLHTKNNE